MSVIAAAAVIVLTVFGAAHQDRPAAKPQDCVKAGRDFAIKRQREAAPLTGEVVRQIDDERTQMVRACGAPFDVEKIDPRDLPALVELYTESKQPELAERAIARGLAPGVLDTPERANLLQQAIRSLLRQPKSDARNAKAETYMSALDALPDDVISHKAAAHIALNRYYRGDDIDAGIIRHAQWLIDAAPRLSPSDRTRIGGALVSAYEYLAEALAGQGDNDRAIELLKRAPTDLSDIPTVESRVRDTLARYLLVGKPAAALSAPVWLNAPEGTTTLDVKGPVTYLQFTAHWCGPCRESYPGIQRLRKRFSGQPFRVVLATELYGYFERERNLTAEQETGRDRDYFAGLGLDVPIAISPSGRSTVDGKPVYTRPANDAAYEVGGIPQINIIDSHGILRRIIIGYDEANEEKLAAFIRQLIAEK